MSEEALRDALRAAVANRALIYRHVFQVLSKRLGEAEATEIMKEAIYNRGLEVGTAFRQYAPNDLTGLKDAFLAYIPDDGRMLEPEVKRADGGGVDLKFHRCPLKEAWQAAGVSDEELAKLCDIAATVDYGTFEGAGFSLEADSWRPGEEGCCFLHIRPGPKAG